MKDMLLLHQVSQMIHKNINKSLINNKEETGEILLSDSHFRNKSGLSGTKPFCFISPIIVLRFRNRKSEI